MLDKDEERWRQLCEQASKEQDPAKLKKLLAEINSLLSAQHDRLKKRWTPESAWSSAGHARLPKTVDSEPELIVVVRLNLLHLPQLREEEISEPALLLWTTLKGVRWSAGCRA